MESFIDSHAHLADEAFAGDRDQVIARARDAGATAIVCIGASLQQARDSARIAQAYPGFVSFTAGIHPHDAASFDPQRDIAELDALVALGAVAIGECGLDYHYDNSPRDLQRRAFSEQLALAQRHSLPVVVHTRDAEDDTAAMVAEAGKSGVGGVLHCFTGSPALAQVAIDARWYISFSGIVTFRNWNGDDVIRMVPDDRLLVESDAPYLAPIPHRGRRNEPAWVALTAARVAAVREIEPDLLSRMTISNARTFFGLELPSS
ncbi:MAG: TatD family hydrolase [Gemmatimonadota bacterium]|nr:TatD family hydrolase [Gemmatimonadota bacterium]